MRSTEEGGDLGFYRRMLFQRLMDALHHALRTVAVRSRAVYGAFFSPIASALAAKNALSPIPIRGIRVWQE